MQIIKELARTIIVVAVLVAGVSLVSAWTAPTQTPPGGNVSAPVNVGALSQIKSGPLQVNGFRNIGNSIFDGNVGIGTAAPTQKLDVVGFVKGQRLCIGNDCRDAWPSGGGTYVSGGFYGRCLCRYFGAETGDRSGVCFHSSPPAFFWGRGDPRRFEGCKCPSGFTLFKIADIDLKLATRHSIFTCYYGNTPQYLPPLRGSI